MAKNPTTASADAFKIESGIAIPNRQKDVPDYGIPFARLKKGDSMVIPYNVVPKDHARLVLMRYAREAKISVTTRTEKNDKGDEIGLRVWHAGDAPPKSAA